MSRLAIGCLVALCAGTAAPAQTLLHRWPGPDLGAGMGASVFGVGDMDGDGHADLIVGAPNYNASFIQQSAPGFLSVRSGHTGITLFRIKGAMTDPYLGSRVGPAGDVNGDGVLDFLYSGDPNGYYASSVSVRSGKTGNLLHQKVGVYNTTTDLGRSVVGGVDLDGDGFADFAATASGGTGQLFAWSGATGAELYVKNAAPGSFGFGSSLAALGDLDGDGAPELAVGISGAARVEVRSGVDGAVLYVLNGGKRFGGAVAALGDVDGDGFADLVVGAYLAAGASLDEGRAYVHSGVDGALIRELHGSHPGAWFGGTVAGPGDVNGDGTPDVAVGAPFDDELFKDGGRITVFSGADGSELLVLYGAMDGARLGAVGRAGDVNAGGLPDLLVGAPGSSIKAPPGGEALVWASERSPGVYCTAKTNSLGCTPTIWSSGTPSLSGSDFRINAYSLPNEERGALYWGLSPAGVPWLGGFECVGGVQGRRAVLSGGNPSAVFSQPDCSGSFSDPWSSAFMLSAGLSPGESIYAQFVYRDVGDPTGIGLTDALHFDVLP